VKIEFKNDAWLISGDITGNSDIASAGISGGRNVFDFSELRIINSMGVRAWVQGLDKLGISPVYRNCPPSIVMLFNMIPEFLGKEGQVESFLVPTYCETCGSIGNILLKRGQDFEPGESVNLKIPPCTTPACHPEADIDPDSYFYFVTDVLKK
jgi:hypothetical protein